VNHGVLKKISGLCQSSTHVSVWSAIVCFFLLFGQGFSIEAAEVDSFTQQHEPLTDVLVLINAETQNRFWEAVDRTNRISQNIAMHRRPPKSKHRLFSMKKGSDYCNPLHLYDALREEFGGAFVGQFEKDLTESKTLPKRFIPREQSIYQDFIFKEAPTLIAANRMSAILNMNQILVGTDKFGHFFEEGWVYFEKTYIQEAPLSDAIFFGFLTESMIYGAVTTGVFSYADLVANLNGMRFWNHVLAENPDVLTGQRIKPYVGCINRQWQVQTLFDWQEYIDPSWDETHNCVKFRNVQLLLKVKKRLHNLESISHKPSQCLAHQTNWHGVQKKYGNYFPYLVNVEGHVPLPDTLLPDAMFETYWAKIDGDRKKPKWIKRLYQRTSQYLKVWQKL
jgi:hypothetical protein